jgi:hypothetical protein
VNTLEIKLNLCLYGIGIFIVCIIPERQSKRLEPGVGSLPEARSTSSAHHLASASAIPRDVSAKRFQLEPKTVAQLGSILSGSSQLRQDIVADHLRSVSLVQCEEILSSILQSSIISERGLLMKLVLLELMQRKSYASIQNLCANPAVSRLVDELPLESYADGTDPKLSEALNAAAEKNEALKIELSSVMEDKKTDNRWQLLDHDKLSAMDLVQRYKDIDANEQPQMITSWAYLRPLECLRSIQYLPDLDQELGLGGIKFDKLAYKIEKSKLLEIVPFLNPAIKKKLQDSLALAGRQDCQDAFN